MATEYSTVVCFQCGETIRQSTVGASTHACSGKKALTEERVRLERVATAVLAGLCANPVTNPMPQRPSSAVTLARALLAEIDKEEDA